MLKRKLLNRDREYKDEFSNFGYLTKVGSKFHADIS